MLAGCLLPHTDFTDVAAFRRRHCHRRHQNGKMRQFFVNSAIKLEIHSHAHGVQSHPSTHE